MKKILCTMALLCGMTVAQAQHFFHRLDVGTNNIYTFVASNLATAGLNALANDMLFDNSYNYTYYDLSSAADMKIKSYDMKGLMARDLFQDVLLGGKMGYLSFLPGNVNWGIYGSAHYKVNQFKTELYNAASKHNIQKAMFGGGVLFTFGNIEKDSKVIIEAGVRYETPLSYKGAFGDNADDVLNSGLSSHLSVRFNGSSVLQGLGLYADIPHYNQFKKSVGSKLKMYSIGIVYTITPWKVKDMY